MRRHLYLLGLLDSPLCWKCGVREETSAHILCECEALVSLRHAYLGSFFLESEGVKSLGLGAICNFSKVTGLAWFDMGHKGPVKSRPRCIRAERPRTQMQINQSVIYLCVLLLSTCAFCLSCLCAICVSCTCVFCLSHMLVFCYHNICILLIMYMCILLPCSCVFCVSHTCVFYHMFFLLVTYMFILLYVHVYYGFSWPPNNIGVWSTC